MFEIIPIGVTVIDWHRFVGGTNRLINRSPTRELDNAGIEVGKPNSYIPALCEFKNQGTDPRKANDQTVLEHISLSFLVSSSEMILNLIALNYRDLAILLTDPSRNKANYIVTGSLKAWKHAVIKSCSDSNDVELREFFNYIWEFFNKAGFGEIFNNYRRKDLKDNTWCLNEK